MTKERKIYGLPGTGKTTLLMEKIKEFFEEGYGIEEMTVVTYRKPMAKELIRRIRTETDADLGGERGLFYVGTIHGICKRLLDIKKEEVADKEDKKKFCEEVMV